jgi:hypothetical protein
MKNWFFVPVRFFAFFIAAVVLSIAALPAFADTPGTLAFASPTYSIAQTGGFVTISVNRTGGTLGAVSVNYAFKNDTAVAGTDYTAASGTLNWAAGDSSAKTFIVPVSAAVPFGGSRGFSVVLMNPTGSAALGTVLFSTIVSISGSGTPVGTSYPGISNTQSGTPATLGEPSTTVFDGLVTILDPFAHMPKHGLDAAAGTMPSALAAENKPYIPGVKVLARRDAVIFYLPNIAGAADYRAYAVSNNVTFTSTANGTEPRGAVVACAGFHQHGYESATNGGLHEHALMQAVEVPGLYAGNYTIILEATSSPCPFTGLPAFADETITETSAFHTADPVSYPYSGTHYATYRAFTTAVSMYGNEILNGQGGVSSWENRLTLSMGQAVAPGDSTFPSDPVVIARSAVAVQLPYSDESANAPIIDNGPNSVEDDFQTELTVNPSTYTVNPDYAGAATAAGAPMGTIPGAWQFWGRYLQQADGQTGVVNNAWSPVGMDGLQIFEHNGRMYTLFGDAGEDVGGAIGFASLKVAPQQLDNTKYIHSMFRINSEATDRRYWTWSLCGAATQAQLQNPTTHMYNVRPIFVETTFDGGVTDSNGNLMAYADNPSIGAPQLGSEPLDQAANPKALECLSIAMDGTPEYPRTDDGVRSSSVIRAQIHPAGYAKGLISLGNTKSEPNVMQPGFRYKLDDKQNYIGALTDPFDQPSPLTHYDFFVRRDRLVAFINGRQAFCVDLSAHPLTMNYGMITYGDLLYHSALEWANIADPNTDGVPTLASQEYQITLNSPIASSRAWDVIGESDEVDVPSQFATFDPGNCFKPAVVEDLSLSSTNYNVAQNGGSVTVTVNRTNSQGTVSVNYTTSDATAAAGTDYTVTSGTLNWADGDATAKTFTVPISNATAFNGNKTFNVNLSNPTGWETINTAAATVTINGGSGSGSGTNGVCGVANGTTTSAAPTANLCNAGTVSTVAGTGPWTWSCTGANGGSNASCAAPTYGSSSVTVVNGTCGSANGTTVSTAPTTNFCTAGTASSVSGSGPWTWNCTGSNGGTNASCSASLSISGGGVTAVNGSCGTANNVGVTAIPSANLCSTGTASSVTGSGPWSWSCAGSNGGTNASCLAPLSINGVCGTSNGTTVSSAPTTNFCTAGTASSVTGSGPWAWSCTGSNGGTNASCSASLLSTTNGTLALSASTYSVAQSAGTVTITVNRTGGNTAESVNYATSNGTAVAGTDYTAESGTLNWAASNVAAQTFTVPVSNATAFTGGKTFTITLSSVNGASLGTSTATVTINGSGTSGTFGISVQGNQLINQSGTPIQLRGANMSGLEFGYDPFQGTSMSTITAGLQSWNINVVRLPLNEGYWLGTCAFSAGNYQSILASAVSGLTQAGIYVILDLHETSATNACPASQDYMANTVHSITFWQQVAQQFANNPAVMFELFNEPHTSDNPIPETQAEWNELLNGGINGNSQYAGMQQLLNAVRGAGATNVVLVDGLNWAADLGHVNSSDSNGLVVPADTVNPAQIAGVMHYYYDGDYNASGNYYLSHGLPLIITEYGDNDGTDTNTTSLYTWADPNGTASQVSGVGGSSFAGVSYVAWAWVWSSGWGGIPDYQLVNSPSGTVFPASTYATEVNSHYTAGGSGSGGSSGGGTAVNGSCGSSNGTTVSSAPSTNLCTAGTASSVSGSGPWTWSCIGSIGGTTASCSASFSTTTGTNGTLALSASTYSVVQNAGTVTITVNRTGGNTAESVNYATSNGTATAGSQYTAASGTLNWTASDTTAKTFTVAISNATPFTGSKTFTITLSSASGATLGTSTATVTINGSGAAVNGTCGSANGTTVSTVPTTNLCTAGTASSVTGSGPWTWSCTGSNSGTTASCSASKTPTAVNGTCGSANGVAVSAAPSTNLCSTGTASSVTGSGPWSWNCTGSNGGTNASCAAPLSVSSTPGTLALANPTFIGQQVNGSVTITVNRTGGSSGAVSVPFATSDGTAVSGTNYTGISGVLSWANGDSTPKSFTVALATTPAFKLTKNFTVTLGSTTGNAGLGTSSATVTVYGSIAALVSSYSLSSASYGVVQNTGSVAITVVLNGSTYGPATVQYATSNGTAVAGTDYTASSGIVSFNPGDTSETFNIPISTATPFVGTKSFTVTLSNAAPGTLTAPTSALVSITGSSVAPVITIGLNPASVAINATSTLSWSATGATSCTGSGAWSGTQATSGTKSVSAATAGTYNFTLSCTGPGGSSSQTAALTVAPAPTVSLTATPTSITLGQSTSLSWTVTNATSCTGSNAWSGTVSPATSGSQSVTPTSMGSFTYTLTCTGAGGSANASAGLTVTANPLQTKIAAAQTTATTNAACTALASGQNGNDGFYWEIGNAGGIVTDTGSGMTAAGTIGVDYNRASALPIESASKMIYADYVAEYVASTQNNRLVIPAPFVPYLNETSGYNNMPPESCAAASFILTCLDVPSSLVTSGTVGTQVTADIGKFYYNAGHAEVLESGQQLAIGDFPTAKITATSLAAKIAAAFAQKGVTVNLTYRDPAPTTGITTTPADYAAFLQATLRASNPLNMQYLLYPTVADPYAVCTNPSDPACAAAAVSTPIPANESWHYSAGHWIEDDATTGDGAFSSPGEYGFYPWIDQTKTYYGLIARNNQTAASAFFDSVKCGRLIRKAFVTGSAQ